MVNRSVFATQMDTKIILLDKDVDLLNNIKPLYLYGISYFDLG